MQISLFISDSYSINLCLGYQLCLICLLIPLYFSTHLHRYPGIILPNVWTLPSESCLPFCLVQVYSYLCGHGGDVTYTYMVILLVALTKTTITTLIISAKEILFLQAFFGFFFVCLFVRLSVNNFTQKLWTDFNEIFWKCRGWYKEESIRFWKLSVDRRPPPTFKDKITLNILITTDHILMKFLPEMHQGPRKFSLYFWTHP